jgi:hypothetical protein
MRHLIWTMLTAVCLLAAACGSQEQPAAKPAPPATTAPAPPTAPAEPPVTPPTATPAQQPKSAAAVAEAPKTPVAAPVPAPKQAPAPKTDIPDSVTFDASQGRVILPHLVHAKLYPCATCHGEGTPGKINLGKDAAHDLCRDCHKAKGAGPTTCLGCHKK